MRKALSLGLLVCVLALGMMVIGCDPNAGGTDPALNGNWDMGGGMVLKMNNGSFEVEKTTAPTGIMGKGTFTTTGNSITVTATEYTTTPGTAPLSRSDMKTAMQEAYPAMSEADIDEQLDTIFLPQTGTYAISGNTLTFTGFTAFPGPLTKQGVPAITTTSLPGGAVGSPYSQTLTATGNATITWSIASGSLPAGLSLSTTGTISGNPTAEGTSNFTVKATNAAGNDTKALSIVIVSETSDFDGTWIYYVSETPYFKVIASGGNFVQSRSSGTPPTWTEFMKGTYPPDAQGTVTSTITEIHTGFFGDVPGEWTIWENLSSERQSSIGSQTFTTTILGNQFTSGPGTYTKQP